MSQRNEVSVGGLMSAIKRAWLKVLIIGLIISVLTFLILTQMSPRYFSESRVLISPVASYQNPAAGREQAETGANIDQATILSQIQVIQSRDIIARVISNYGLMDDEKFQSKVASAYTGTLGGLLPFSLSTPYEKLDRETREQITIDLITENLQVVSLSQSRVLAIRYYSGNPVRAAGIANSVADAYINWQRSEKVQQNQDDSIRLARLINDLKDEVKKSEAAVADYRAQKGIYKSTRNDVTLSRQQLTELNSRIIAARERRAESEIRAKLIRDMLDRDGQISTAPETMRSPMINRLFEQKTRVERSISELGATLLPTHPRIQQLRSEHAGINRQIRSEMARLVEAVENDAKIARARETALQQSLKELKNLSNRSDGDEIQLRALEREANTNRDLLNTYLARFRDAEARKESAIAPSYATIVSKAHVPTHPYFPRIMPLTLLALVASILLGFGWVIIQAVLRGMETEYNYETGYQHQREAYPGQEQLTHDQDYAHNEGQD